MTIEPWIFVLFLVGFSIISYLIGIYDGSYFGPKTKHIPNNNYKEAETAANEKIEMIIKELSDRIVKEMRKREKLLDKDGEPIYNKRIVKGETT